MKKAIVYGYDIPDCERLYTEYCKQNNIFARRDEVIFLFRGQSFSTMLDKVRGYYNEVMNDKIKLIGIDKDFFHTLYFKFF